MAGDWLMRGDDRLLRVDELQLSGRHNAGNVLAALALAAAAGIDQDAAVVPPRHFPDCRIAANGWAGGTALSGLTILRVPMSVRP